MKSDVWEGMKVLYSVHCDPSLYYQNIKWERKFHSLLKARKWYWPSLPTTYTLYVQCSLAYHSYKLDISFMKIFLPLYVSKLKNTKFKRLLRMFSRWISKLDIFYPCLHFLIKINKEKVHDVLITNLALNIFVATYSYSFHKILLILARLNTWTFRLLLSAVWV